MMGTYLEIDIPMRWGDMDAYGHINNVEIVRMLEEARVHAFGRPAGTGAPGVEPEFPVFRDLPAGVQILVVEHWIKYRAPLRYRNIPAKVQVWITALKPASLTLAYRISDPVDGVECALAETVLAFYDEPAGVLRRIDAARRASLEPLLGTSIFPR
ncbi:acyl-CoA thioesterase [Acaricomes phytoseiuli]|uniref:acyl-CoA thioesterase n=1 Tax=Acaricomes phytoseiuli TaxID=291968 RepID=UPI002223826B|nr:acyl-CoA thioesterase [Acaricomes phytoseiuli]MCW1250467.1 acyl-CoA thioesterase [Acaricomes phytoseiuli]